MRFLQFNSSITKNRKSHYNVPTYLIDNHLFEFHLSLLPIDDATISGIESR